MRTSSIVILLLLLPGCFARIHTSTQPSKVSQFQTTPIPVPPPVPDAAPVGQDVAAATFEATQAQSGVQQVLNMARTIPAAQPAVTPLSNADAHLSAAVQKLNDASGKVSTLSEGLLASEQAHKSAEASLRGDIDTLKAAAVSDGAKSAKEKSALEAENEQLRDESIRQAKARLLWAGIAMLLGAGGCIAGAFYGFLAGPKLAGLFGVVGVFLITISQLLQKIVYWGEMTAIGVCVALVVYLVWHAFHHDPLVMVPPEAKTHVS